MKKGKRIISALTSMCMSAAALTSIIPERVSELSAYAAASYPVQEFRLGMADTDNNVTASGASLAPAEMQGTSDEKWSLNYISSGVYEIVNSATGQILTANGSAVSLAADTDGSNQRWKIEGVQKDFDGYYLYYKITSNADSSKSLTFSENSGAFSLASYTGDTYQKYKLNLDGLEGFAANCMTSSGEKAGTIGGLLGEVVYVSSADELETQLNTVGAQTIVITADIDMQKKGNTRIRDNKTIVGSYSAHTIYDSQFRTNDAYGAEDDSPSDNIVFRNLDMEAKNVANRILINIWSSRQIWIDHITFNSQLTYDRTGNGQDEVGKFIWINTPYDSYYDAKDRLRSPDYVTISYCKFTHRYWTVAYGTQNDEITRDRTTLLYNWWNENVRRCPQLGNGSAHVYNNYYSAYGTSSNGSATSGIIGGDGSDMVSENNMFNGYSLSQALMMGGGSDPARDSGSYLSTALNGSASAVSFSPKVTSSWYPNKTNYGYELLDAYNTKNTDTKAFCTKYAGCFSSASGIKYITDSDFESWISTRYASPFLRHVEFKTKQGAEFDTSYDYTIKNVNSGLYLQVAEGAASSGTSVVQGKLADKKAYTWHLTEAGDGYYYIYTCLGDGKTYCIDLPYGNTDNGNSIGIWSNDESDARKFKFIDNGDGTYTITTKSTGDASCFGVISNSTEDGADVIQWVCNGHDSQKWYVYANMNGELFSDVSILDNEYYTGWKIGYDLAAGSEVFGDRDSSRCAVTEFSDGLAGAEILMTACDAKALTSDLAEITAGNDMIAYAAFDSRVTSAPSWLSGWTKTSLTINTSNDLTFVLYSKEFSSGDIFTIGQNGQSSGCMNYFVIAVRKIAETTTTTTAATTTTTTTTTTTATQPISEDIDYGNANCDAAVNVADSVLILQALANSDKYGINGSDKDHITEQGYKNADCSKSRDGVTAMDALYVQQYTLKLITLPVD